MKIWHVVAALAAAAVLAVAYYLISPLFRVVYADEPVPTAAAQPAQPPAPAAALATGTPVAEAPAVAEAPPVGAPVIGTPGHPASGTARVVVADGRTYVRYENFSTINGPDIYVYLAKDLNADEYVSLGRVKATEGNVNYEVPPGVNVGEYPYVLTWCKMFGVLFNHAAL